MKVATHYLAIRTKTSCNNFKKMLKLFNFQVTKKSYSIQKSLRMMKTLAWSMELLEKNLNKILAQQASTKSYKLKRSKKRNSLRKIKISKILEYWKSLLPSIFQFFKTRGILLLVRITD